MPTAKVHDKVTLISTPILILVTLYFFGVNLNIILLNISYIFAGLMFNGDLDIHSRPYNRWFILKGIWIPYQLLFKHRSVWTHGFIIGTLIRIIYLLFIPFLFFYSKIIYYICNNIELIIYIIIGLELGAMSHSVIDFLF